MSNGSAPVSVAAEEQDGIVPEVCLELVGKAKELGDSLGASAEVVLLGDISDDQLMKLYHAGAAIVYRVFYPGFDRFQTDILAEMISSLAREHQPQIMLIGSTFLGRELAPLLAAKLNTGLTAHCIDLLLDDKGILEQWIPAYGGLISITCPDARPQIATIARGVFPAPKPDTTLTGKLVSVSSPDNNKSKVKTLEIIQIAPEGVPLEEAQTVVAGGAGAGSPEGWKDIENLAEVLNAALGSTRPVVDEGWIDLETMIGQSGKMVHPDLYIGVGLSGEQQHMVGIAGAKVMVAINNDPDSPIFQQVDLGIVEDCREFIPVFINKLKERKV